MNRLLAARLAAMLVTATLTGCSHEQPAPVPDPTPAPGPRPAYDGALTPALAVLALVPDRADTVEVDDYTQAHRMVGLPDLTSASDPADLARWRAEGTREAVLLGVPLLRADDRALRPYGFGADDVAWQATWSGAADGWALRMRDGVDMGGVQRAVDDGVGALAGARVRRADHLVVHGSKAGPVWGSDPWWSGLVGDAGSATWLHRGCDPRQDPGRAELDPLDGVSLTFGDHLATVRMGPDRTDLFDRLDLARGTAAFRRVFTQGVGDPDTGRLGFAVRRPEAAARAVARGDLPFAACAD